MRAFVQLGSNLWRWFYEPIRRIEFHRIVTVKRTEIWRRKMKIWTTAQTSKEGQTCTQSSIRNTGERCTNWQEPEKQQNDELQLPTPWTKMKLKPFQRFTPDVKGTALLICNEMCSYMLLMCCYVFLLTDQQNTRLPSKEHDAKWISSNQGSIKAKWWTQEVQH